MTTRVYLSAICLVLGVGVCVFMVSTWEGGDVDGFWLGFGASLLTLYWVLRKS